MRNSKNKGRSLFSETQKRFIEKLIESGEVDVSELAAELGVSRATIYNHYNYLMNLNFERRLGKIKLERRGKDILDPFVVRQSRNQLLKEKIAEYVVKNFIKDNDEVYLDGGSTTLFIADHIREHEVQDLAVITTNPYIFMRLFSYEKLRRLSVIGGVADRDSGTFFGPWVESLLGSMDHHFQKSFLGVDGLCAITGKKEGVVALDNLFELEQEKLIISKSEETYILLDESKIGRGGEVLLRYPSDWNPSVRIVLGCKNTNTQAIKEIEDVFKDQVILVQGDGSDNT